MITRATVFYPNNVSKTYTINEKEENSKCYVLKKIQNQGASLVFIYEHINNTEKSLKHKNKEYVTFGIPFVVVNDIMVTNPLKVKKLSPKNVAGVFNALAAKSNKIK